MVSLSLRTPASWATGPGVGGAGRGGAGGGLFWGRWGGGGRGGRGGILNITLIGADVHVGLPSGVQKVEKRGVFDPFLGLRGP